MPFSHSIIKSSITLVYIMKREKMWSIPCQAVRAIIHDDITAKTFPISLHHTVVKCSRLPKYVLQYLYRVEEEEKSWLRISNFLKHIFGQSFNMFIIVKLRKNNSYRKTMNKFAVFEYLVLLSCLKKNINMRNKYLIQQQ